MSRSLGIFSRDDGGEGEMCNGRELGGGLRKVWGAAEMCLKVISESFRWYSWVLGMEEVVMHVLQQVDTKLKNYRISFLY